MSVRTALPLALVLAAAALLRWMGIGNRPIWVDEAFSALVAWKPPAGILDSLRSDANPPLYFLLLHGWIGVAGSSPEALRALSAVIDVAGIGIVFGAARSILPARPRAALIAAAIAAVAPLNLYYAHQARMYTLSFAVGAASLWTLHRLITRAGSREIVAHAVVLGAGLYTHNFWVFVLPVTVVAAWLARRAALRPAALAIAGAVLLYVPWVPAVLEQGRSGVDAWIRPFWQATPPPAALLRSLEVMGIGGAFPLHMQELGAVRDLVPLGAGWTLMRIAGAAAGIATVASAFAPGARRAGRHRETTGAPDRVARVVLSGHLLIPLCLAILVSFLVRPIFLVGRHEMAVMPAFVLLVGAGVDRLLASRRAAGAAAAGVWVVGAGLITAAMAMAKPNDPERHVASWLANETRDEDAAVVPGFLYPVLEYHGARMPIPCRRIPFPPEVGEHPGWFDSETALAEAATLARQADQLAASLEPAIERGASVVLVKSTRTPEALNRRIEEALTRRFGSPAIEGGTGISMLRYGGESGDSPP